MCGISACMEESTCEGGSCFTELIVLPDSPHTVYVNKTGLVGITVTTKPKCQCQPKTWSVPQVCGSGFCLNGGNCKKHYTDIR